MTIREITEKRIFIFDGAMGTYFASKAHDYQQPCEMANIELPDIIKDIHKEYIEAGCDAIKTNTFSAGPHNPAFPSDRFADAIKAGCRIAKEAASEAARKIHIFGDIGPVIGAEEDEAADIYIQIADIFDAEGIENFLFETLSSDAGIVEAAAYIKEKILIHLL